MEYFQRSPIFTNAFGRSTPSVATLFSFKHLTSVQQKHLTNVYAVLSAGVIVAAAGAYVSLNYFQIPLLLCMLGDMAGVMYVAATTSNETSKVKDPKRAVAFGTTAFLSGASLGPLLSMASFLNPSIITQALFATLAIFAAFSLCAIFAKRRTYLYVGAILSSLMFYLSIISIANLFFRTRLGHDIVLYVGLMVYIGYVFCYTQETLDEAAHGGNKDYVLHALRFFIVLVGVFVRLLIILMQNEQKKNDDRKRRRD